MARRKRWDTSADGRTWTFHLVGNARFHNGDPVDAEAVRFSFERALKLNKGVSWMLKAYLEPVRHRRRRSLAPCASALSQPYGAFLSFIPLWFIVNPKQVMAVQAGEDYGQKFLVDGDAGSGPFRIKRWDGQAVMALEAVADYWKRLGDAGGGPAGRRDLPRDPRAGAAQGRVATRRGGHGHRD